LSPGERVLVVDDDAPVRRMLERSLLAEGFAVDSAADGGAALVAAERTAHEVIVLDVAMAGLSGLEVCRRLRAKGASSAILMLTARDAVPDRVAGLEAGADDYLVKPFGAGQLDARIRAVLRRATASDGRGAAIQVGALVVDSDARTARLDGLTLDLTPREFDLLRYLAERAGQVVTRRELLAEVWRQPYGGADKTVDVHLSWLRRKLGETALEPRYLHTVRSVGVRLDAPVPSPSSSVEISE